MSNKTQLQENNTKLNTILSNALGLPTQESMKNGKYVWKKSKRGIDSVEVKGSYTKGMANYGMLLSTGKALFDNNKKYIGKPNSDNFPAGETGFYILAPSTDNKGQIIDGETIYHITGFTVGNVNLPDVEMYNDYKINYTETFISYVVSDNESEYPDKAVHSDGFYYEKVVEGVDLLGAVNLTKCAVDTLIFSSVKKEPIYHNHSLGTVPKLAILLCDDKGITYNGFMRFAFLAYNITGSNLNYATASMITDGNNSAYEFSYMGGNSPQLVPTSKMLRFNESAYGSLKYKDGVKYTLITMA